MLWTWLFNRSPRLLHTDQLPNAIRDEVLSMCRAQAIARDARGEAVLDCGCINPR